MLYEVITKTRYSGLPLAGDDNVIGANQIVTWQSGYPLVVFWPLTVISQGYLPRLL